MVWVIQFGSDTPMLFVSERAAKDYLRRNGNELDASVSRIKIRGAK